MELRTVIIPERRANIGLIRPHIVTLEEITHTYAPTLATVHNWLFSDLGPFSLSWRDGALCPFHPQVGRKNITCCKGRRGIKKCPGIGLTITNQDIKSYLSNQWQRRIAKRIGNVQCYEWNHVLAKTYWSLSFEKLLELPDNPSFVAFIIMRQVFRESGWRNWLMEAKARQNGKKKWEWLKSISPSPYSSA